MEDKKRKTSQYQSLLKRTQAVFNAYIRLRDANLPCISCGRYDVSAWHAGHYIAVGECSSLRFHPLNTHKQCGRCNRWRHGALIAFRRGLIKKIGVEAVEWLEGYHQPHKWSLDELQRIKEMYLGKIKELKGEIKKGGAYDKNQAY